MKLRIEKLSSGNLGHAMRLVTESFNQDVYRGQRDPDYIQDWEEEYEILSEVASGRPYAGYLTYCNQQPLGVSVVSKGDEEGLGEWSWFYVSPRVPRENTFPYRVMATETLRRAQEAGMRVISAQVWVGNRSLRKALRRLHLRPRMVEYVGEVGVMTKMAVGSYAHREVDDGVCSRGGTDRGRGGASGEGEQAQAGEEKAAGAASSGADKRSAR